MMDINKMSQGIQHDYVNQSGSAPTDKVAEKLQKALGNFFPDDFFSKEIDNVIDEIS